MTKKKPPKKYQVTNRVILVESEIVEANSKAEAVRIAKRHRGTVGGLFDRRQIYGHADTWRAAPRG